LDLGPDLVTGKGLFYAKVEFFWEPNETLALIGKKNQALGFSREQHDHQNIQQRHLVDPASGRMLDARLFCSRNKRES
jgi:hypothetical protein